MIHISDIEAMKEFIFPIPNNKKIFKYLKQTFIKVLILQFFDLECNIWIKINTSNYFIDRVLSQLNLNLKKMLNNLYSNKSNFAQ